LGVLLLATFDCKFLLIESAAVSCTQLRLPVPFSSAFSSFLARTVIGPKALFSFIDTHVVFVGDAERA
jgi:hypothetical protein